MAEAHSTIELGEASSKEYQRRHSDKGKTPITEAPLIAKVKRSSYERLGGRAESESNGGMKRGIAILDFVVRLGAITAVLAATISMGTTEQTLPFFTQFFQFQASYDDLPTFNFFVIANAISSAYLVLSLPFSVVTIVNPLAKAPRLLLITFDAVAMTLTTSASGSGAAIVYLAHKGNVNANWVAICQQFDSFCQRISGSVVASFIAVVLMMGLVILSAIALKTH
ncbi:hypothetical protein V2J09_010699 [Rumex salicifolius]